MGVAGVIRTIKDAGRIAQHSIAALETARRRLPASLESCVKQLAICWSVIPDGDRRHGTESRGVIDQVAALIRN